MTISLTLNDIPNYLKDSELCKNIESEESFNVPIELFKKELIINTSKDLIEYIKIFDYWMINKIPDEFYIFVINNKDKINMVLFNDLFSMNDLIKQIKIIVETQNDKISSYFSSIGNLELLKYAHKHNYSWDKKTYELAALNGHLECLKYAYENKCPYDMNCICNNKKEFNDRDKCRGYHRDGLYDGIMVPLYKENEEYKFICNCNNILSNISINGHLDCLKYIINIDIDFISDTYEQLKFKMNAIKNGQLNCIKYYDEILFKKKYYKLFFKNNYYNNILYKYAEEYGNIEYIKYTVKNGYNLNDDQIYMKTKNTHKCCMEYAHDHNIEWNEYICYCAVKSGCNNCLNYKIHNNEINEITIDNGAIYKIFTTHLYKYNKNINHLIFDEYYNHPIENLPETITHLEFKDGRGKYGIINHFSKKLNKLPNTVTHLVLNDLYNLLLDELPSSLKYLSLGWNYKQTIDKLPDSIEEIQFRSGFSRDMEDRYGDFNSPTFNIKINKLPLNLKIFNYIDNIKINGINDIVNLNKIIKMKNKIEETNIYQNYNICYIIAKYGDLECLKYAHENGCPWEYTYHTAAENGHLDCLKYAHENGCTWDEDTCSSAASNGHLDCLKYAHENGCTWDEDTCRYAAENGHLNCLKYAHENDCLLDKNMSIDIATRYSTRFTLFSDDGQRMGLEKVQF